MNQQPVAAAGHGRVVEMLKECPVGAEATLLIQRAGTGERPVRTRLTCASKPGSQCGPGNLELPQVCVKVLNNTNIFKKHKNFPPGFHIFISVAVENDCNKLGVKSQVALWCHL